MPKMSVLVPVKEVIRRMMKVEFTQGDFVLDVGIRTAGVRAGDGDVPQVEGEGRGSYDDRYAMARRLCAAMESWDMFGPDVAVYVDDDGVRHEHEVIPEFRDADGNEIPIPLDPKVVAEMSLPMQMAIWSALLRESGKSATAKQRR